MENSLLDSNLTKENYNDYIEKIYNIFRLSSKRSSIFLSFDISSDKCLIKLKIVGQNGEKEEFSDVTFKVDEDFYNIFLDSLIRKINDDKSFITDDIVNIDKDDYVTFRLLSTNNDLITIDGLTQTNAEKLKNIFETDPKEKEMPMITNRGVSNSKILILMIIIIVISFILIVLLLK